MGLFDKMAIADGTNLKLGRGACFFDRFSTAGAKQGQVFLGNCTTLEVGGNVDTKDKRGSVDDTNPLLASVEVARTFEINISGSEWLKENLGLVMLGTVGEYTQTATPIVGEQLTASTTKGRYYWTAKRKVTAYTVKAAAVAKVEGTDYEIDTETGAVLVKTSGGIADGSILTIDYTPTVLTAGSGLTQVTYGTAGTILGELRFVGKPLAGRIDELHIPKVQIVPAGVLAFISDDFQDFTLKGKVLSDAVNNPTFPFGRHWQR